MERFYLGRLGCLTKHGWRQFKVANILGEHFRSGEWANINRGRRCGSVIVTNVRRKTRYAVVKRFIMCGNDDTTMFAVVSWFTVPVYPYAPNPLVVKVRESHTPDVQPRPVLSLTKIIPTKVTVLPCGDGVHFYMLREKGTDII